MKRLVAKRRLAVLTPEIIQRIVKKYYDRNDLDVVYERDVKPLERVNRILEQEYPGKGDLLTE
jgi:hypothetical protein